MVSQAMGLDSRMGYITPAFVYARTVPGEYFDLTREMMVQIWKATAKHDFDHLTTMCCIARIFFPGALEDELEIAEIQLIPNPMLMELPFRLWHVTVHHLRMCLDANDWPMSYMLDPASPFWRFKRTLDGPYHPGTPRSSTWRSAVASDWAAEQAEMRMSLAELLSREIYDGEPLIVDYEEY